MGFRFSKSFGGKNFRINISKSGIGYSYGIPGYRKTRLASGRTRTTASIPGTGLSYVTESSGAKRKNPSNNQNNKIREENIDMSKDIDNVEEYLYEKSSHEDFIQALKKAKKIHGLSIGFIWFGIILLFTVVYAFGGMLFLTSGIIMYIYYRMKLQINVEYSIEDNSMSEYKEFKELWLKINNSKKIWEIVSEKNNSNLKVHSGASSSVERVATRFEETKLPYLNIGGEKILKLKLRKKEILFLKDKIVIFEKGKVAGVDYKNIKLDFSSQRFVESETVAKDANVIDYTWQYVNKNGQPDKRYSDNRQLPICLYGKINISDMSGAFNIELQMSNYEIYKEIGELIKESTSK